MDKRLLIAAQTHLEQPDPVLLAELEVLGRVLLGQQQQNALQPERLQKREVLRLRERAAVDPGAHHTEVGRRLHGKCANPPNPRIHTYSGRAGYYQLFKYIYSAMCKSADIMCGYRGAYA